MLGRKQSLKGEPVLADYGPEESLNESADIEWVNKVQCIVLHNKMLLGWSSYIRHVNCKLHHIMYTFYSYGYVDLCECVRLSRWHRFH